MLCVPRGCGCAFTSSTLSIAPDESNPNLIRIEQAELTELTEIQADIDALEAAVAALQAADTSMLSTIAGLQKKPVFGGSGAGSGVTTSGTTVTAMHEVSTGPVPAGLLGIFFQISYTKTVDTDRFLATFRIGGSGGGVSGAQYDEDGTIGQATFARWMSVAAAADHTLGVYLQRVNGTGTATSIASPATSLWWAVFPT